MSITEQKEEIKKENFMTCKDIEINDPALSSYYGMCSSNMNFDVRTFLV